MPSITHPNIIIKLNSSRRVKFHFLQSLSNNIIRLSFAALGRLDGGRLIDISLVIDIQLTECILQTEYLVLLELRIFPVPEQSALIWHERILAPTSVA
jgi:hypothetical protein